MSGQRVRASDIEDWSRVPKEFMPGAAGKASMLTWGKSPDVGTVIGLRHPEGGMAAYRVIERAQRHFAADYDGIIVRLEFIPGRSIEP